MSIITAIGNTPMIRLDNINPYRHTVPIYGKYEGANPGGSIKDRAALHLIHSGIRSGELTKEKIVIEATSGNTGIGIAMICATLGFNCLLVMSEGCSIERRQLMEAYGASILLTPKEKGTDGAIEAVEMMLKAFPGKYWNPNQFDNPASWEAHYYGTAKEILIQVPQITHFISAIGTTGTIIGCSKFFLASGNTGIKVIAVQPLKHSKIQGLKNLQFQRVPEIYNKRLINETISVEDADAMFRTKELARKEGLLVGMSSGAAVAVAIQVASTLPSGSHIVVILPDRGNNYISTGVYR